MTKLAFKSKPISVTTFNEFLSISKMTKSHMWLCCIMVFISFVSCKEEAPNADMIVTSSNIYTGSNAEGDAIVIKDEKIIFIGSLEEASEYEGESTEVIDAQGAFVMPGLIEGHGHFSGLGQFLMNLNFLRSKSWDEIVSKVEEKVAQSEPGEWIIGRGWHQEKWIDPVEDHVHGYPKHFDLSLISPDNPVLLVHASGHGVFANEKAMELAGVQKETPNPTGGEIVRDNSGSAIGMFEERAASIIYGVYQEYLEGLSQEEQIENWYKGIELAQDECFKKGITSFQDAGSHFDEIIAYKELAESNKMRIRLWAMLRESSADMSKGIEDYKAYRLGKDRFTCMAIKSELDGALGSFGAWLLEPYDDKEDFYGQNTTTLEEMTAKAQIAFDNGMQFCVHGIGDRANRETLNIFEDFIEQKPGEELRWRIEHSQHLHPDDIPRFKELGVIAAMQAIHCTSDAPFVEKRLGAKRAKEGAYNWRALLDSGAIVNNGTDAPVEDVDAFESLYASVTRKRVDSGLEFFPENSMSREEALHSYTLANAYSAFEEDIKGSLEVGKLGDITIVSKNFLTCTDEEILETDILYTIVGGKVMYKKEG